MLAVKLSYFISHIAEYGLGDKTGLWITTDESDGIPVVNVDYEPKTLAECVDQLVADVPAMLDTDRYAATYWTIMGDSVNVSVRKLEEASYDPRW